MMILPPGSKIDAMWASEDYQELGNKIDTVPGS